MSDYRIEPIKGGFAVLWGRSAVHGKTEEEALANYREALEMHRRIDERIAAEERAALAATEPAP